MTSYRIATLAAACSANALLSLLMYLPELTDEERADDIRAVVVEADGHRHASTSTDLGTRLPS
jgi:hypothetical protein